MDHEIVSLILLPVFYLSTRECRVLVSRIILQQLYEHTIRTNASGCRVWRVVAIWAILPIVALLPQEVNFKKRINVENSRSYESCRSSNQLGHATEESRQSARTVVTLNLNRSLSREPQTILNVVSAYVLSPVSKMRGYAALCSTHADISNRKS